MSQRMKDVFIRACGLRRLNFSKKEGDYLIVKEIIMRKLKIIVTGRAD